MREPVKAFIIRVSPGLLTPKLREIGIPSVYATPATAKAATLNARPWSS